MNVLGKILSYCGINCAECPAYLATQKNDAEEIKKVANEWSSDAMKFAPEELYCDGCINDGKLVSWAPKCDIRICCREKGLENCAYCIDYFCDKLKNTFDKSPSAKENLEEIRQNL
ncbi:MAG: DUF3795 domain-containing protein [Candidatus Lokiarchaeota archaeon]|nr:DUF3795 domain-containing protein [Candidatus Lokiarchaeota archaeon]